MHLSKFTKAVIITAGLAFMESIKSNFVYNDTRHLSVPIYRHTSKLLKLSPN